MDEQMANTSQSNSRIRNSRLNELHESLALQTKTRKKTKTEAKSEFPQISQTMKNSSIPISFSSLNENKHLRYLYHEFCKQSYMGGINATFDQISQSADKMTLNKWMVFCREFNLTKRLSARQMKLIFKKATNQHSHMDLDNFCEALQRIQLKANIDHKELVKDILHADSHDSARHRLCNMKVSFAGPRKNFFIEGSLPEKVRQEEKTRQKIFKEKQQRQYIMHQGMFQDHISREVKERKQAREQKNRHLKNFSVIDGSSNRSDPLSRYSNNLSKLHTPRSVNTKASKSSFGSYSKIYHTQKANTADTKSYLATERRGEDMQSRSRLLYEKKRQTQNDVLRQFDFEEKKDEEEAVSQEEEVPQQIEEKEQRMSFQEKWNIDSDQSDEILRSHFENEKKIRKSRQKHQERQSTPAKKEDEQQLVEENEEEDTDMMITKYM